MANYSSLKNALANVIKPNDNQEITGQIMQDALMAMINALGAGYQFAGVPTAQTDPSTPDQNVFYIAGAGTYPNFGGTVVPRGSVGVFRYNGSWDYSVLDVASWADASNKLYYNTQAGNVAAKTIQADGFTLQPGGWIKIHFDNANTVDNPTLNVNNTGAHTMTFNSRTVSATNSWKTGETVAFYYDNYGVGIWHGIRLVEYPDFINVNELVGQTTPFASESAARSAIPQQNRKAGLNIAYLLSTGEETSQWQLDMFIGDDVTDWSVADNWKVVGPVSVSQNSETGHTDINIGSNSTPVASVDEVSQLGQEVNGVLYPNYFEDKYVDKDGNIVDAQYWGVTSFIPYISGNVYWLAGYTSGSRCLVFYDNNFTPIAGAFYGASSEEIIIQQEEIPTDARYIRASYFLDAESPYVKIGDAVVWDFSKKSDGLIARVEELEYLKNEVAEIKPNNAIITEDIIIGQDGYYIDENGNRQPYASYGISEIIPLLKGDVLSANIMASATAYLCRYNGSDTSYIVLLYNSRTINDFTYTADEDMSVVICGSKSSFSTYTIQRETNKAASEYSVEKLSERVTILEESSARISLVNPYAGVDYNNLVQAQSHEHSYKKERLESAYNRGIRLFAVSHYQPSVPRYPLSKTPLTWMDYKSREDVDNGDYELVERTQTANTGITQLDVDSGTINTDNIPQIANAERPYIRSDSHFYPEHFNILGLLWGDPGVMLANDESSTSWKKAHSLETISKIQELLADETMWQFGPQYAFGTINHNKSISDTKAMLDTLPQIFKAMELFNQGYSEGWNQEFRNTYDAILRQGYRIWGTAVVDWQGDWASWSYTTDAEKAEWEEMYNALPAEEQAQYGSAENYYMQIGRFKFDRGANVLLMPNGYESLSPALQAKEGIKAYIQGRYYMVGVGNYSMRMAIDGNTITFRVSDFCPKIKIITANGVSELTNTDTARYTPSKTDKYVRFEAEWDDGDFIFSNPIFIDLIN